MANFSQFGNDLYTGARSYNFVGRRKVWYIIAAVMIAISVIVPIARGGFVFGIEFTGGSEFQVANIGDIDNNEAQSRAIDTVSSVVDEANPRATTIGAGDSRAIRVQTEALSQGETNEVRDALVESFDVSLDAVSASLIGPTWGADITASAIRALVVFVLLAAIFMAIYFRTWKMSVAANVSLVHDLVITVGVYGIFGFEITPAAVIGLLTILGYSLYDTVVVFDKIRENTLEDTEGRRTFSQSVNLAVNQTLVRSINTGVIAVLPVAAILIIGAVILGAGTLRDIALALFIGTIVGTYSTIFIAAPIYAQLRENEPAIKQHTKRLQAERELEPTK